MNKVHMPFSKKNIPIPPKKEYYKKSYNAISSLCHRMAWFAHFHLNKDESKEDEEVEYYGFRSGYAPPQDGSAVIQKFMSKLTDLFTGVKFRRSQSNVFQDQLESWLSEVTSEKKVIVPADKTRNYYQLTPKDYRRLLSDNITQEYKKATS